jgi:radical SAM/Cys-rich protein
MNDFDLKIREIYPGGLLSDDISTLQVNLGRHCNLSCNHCHLECSAIRTEQMSQRVMQQVVALAKANPFWLVDITGGAPELHPLFGPFLEEICSMGRSIQVRTNLTTFADPGMQDMIHLLKEKRVSLVGSLPCYLEENVDAQRGRGVYEKSICALLLLNESGYGVEEGMTLNLVFNPGGPFLPPGQPELESVYREELKQRFGIQFSRLIVLANMPLGRFKKGLERDLEINGYMKLLRDAFNAATVPHLMCRHQISVDWDGTIYDCDFNLALGMSVNHGAPDSIERIDMNRLAGRAISTGLHCFGCTAGAGSSCSGALTDIACSS